MEKLLKWRKIAVHGILKVQDIPSVDNSTHVLELLMRYKVCTVQSKMA
jgi:hypothetical protein